MATAGDVSRRRFLRTAVAFSAAAALQGCGSGIRTVTQQDPVVEDPSHFLMVGDWGSVSNMDDQTDVAKAMQAYQAKWKFSTDALLMLGDNFYGDMNGGVASSRWKTSFENMYPASVFPCPAFAVPGNHDYQRSPVSKVDAEVGYSALGASRWSMPSLYRSFPFPAVDPVVMLYFVDSNMPGEPAQPPPPDGSYYTPTDADRVRQLAWLTAELSKPKTTLYRVVVGHHPLYTNGSHGDNQTLIRDWDPLFRANGVDLYLAGHDHDLQHLEFAGHPTSFVCSGGGGAELSGLSSKIRGPYANEVHGFTHLQITRELMTLRHLDTTGGLLHKFVRTPSGTVTIVK